MWYELNSIVGETRKKLINSAYLTHLCHSSSYYFPAITYHTHLIYVIDYKILLYLYSACFICNSFSFWLYISWLQQNFSLPIIDWRNETLIGKLFIHSQDIIMITWWITKPKIKREKLNRSITHTRIIIISIVAPSLWKLNILAIIWI